MRHILLVLKNGYIEVWWTIPSVIPAHSSLDVRAFDWLPGVKTTGVQAKEASSRTMQSS
jgi:hypothetical protein